MDTLSVATTVATCVLAAVAIGALLANVWEARQTRRAVDAAVAETKAVEGQTAALLRQAAATEAQAQASADQAKASQMLAAEAQRTRELEWQPLLVYTPGTPTNVDSLANTGRGPAYRTVVAYRDRQFSISRPPVILGVANKIHPATFPVAGISLSSILPGDAMWAAFCEDHFGNKYRFLDKGAPPDVWRPGEEQSTVMWLQVWRLAEPMTPPAGGG